MMLIQELIAGERDHFRLDKRYRHRDGSYVWVRTSCSAIRDQHGRTEHTISFIEDISEQKRHEEALRESEARFRQLVDNLEDGFWMANADLTELVYASPAIERLWGLSNNQISRDPSAVTAVVHPDDLERLGHYLPPNRITHRIDLQIRVMHADGTMRWLRIRAIPILGTDGAIHRIAGITEDITDRMRAAESIDEIRKHASRLVQAVRQPLGVLHRALPAETDSPTPRAAPEEEDRSRSASRCLTPRQREVMELLVAGRSTKAIAAQLAVSPRTVEVHRSDVMRKLPRRVAGRAGPPGPDLGTPWSPVDRPLGFSLIYESISSRLDVSAWTQTECPNSLSGPPSWFPSGAIGSSESSQPTPIATPPGTAWSDWPSRPGPGATPTA